MINFYITYHLGINGMPGFSIYKIVFPKWPRCRHYVYMETIHRSIYSRQAKLFIVPEVKFKYTGKYL